MRRWLPVLAVIAGLGSSISFAQFGIVDCVGQPTIHVADLKGSVFDPTGVAIPNVNLILKRGASVFAQAPSDTSGRFDFKLPSGKYEMSVQSKEFKAIPLEVRVGFDVHSILHQGQLRWILEVAGMNCSLATTSVAGYEREIRLFKDGLNKDTHGAAAQK